MIKVWKDHPRELAEWQAKVRAERKRLLDHAAENEWVMDLQLPQVPNDNMISMTQDEWRKIIYEI